MRQAEETLKLTVLHCSHCGTAHGATVGAALPEQPRTLCHSCACAYGEILAQCGLGYKLSCVDSRHMNEGVYNFLAVQSVIYKTYLAEANSVDTDDEKEADVIDLLADW